MCNTSRRNPDRVATRPRQRTDEGSEATIARRGLLDGSWNSEPIFNIDLLPGMRRGNFALDTQVAMQTTHLPCQGDLGFEVRKTPLIRLDLCFFGGLGGLPVGFVAWVEKASDIIGETRELESR